MTTATKTAQMRTATIRKRRRIRKRKRIPKRRKAPIQIQTQSLAKDVTRIEIQSARSPLPDREAERTATSPSAEKDPLPQILEIRSAKTGTARGGSPSLEAGEDARHRASPGPQGCGQVR